MKQKQLFIVTILFLVFVMTGCTPYSDFQTAKTVGKGNVELTPFAAANGGFNNVGANIDVGITNNFDLRATYSQVFYTSYGQDVFLVGKVNSNISFLSIAPKISILKDIVAFTVPLDYLYGLSTFIIRPSLLITAPIGRHTDLTISPKSIFMFLPLTKQPTIMPALSLGLSLHPTDRISFKPEIGIVNRLEGVGVASLINIYLGFGVAFKFGK
jgi:hypothetical protein